MKTNLCLFRIMENIVWHGQSTKETGEGQPKIKKEKDRNSYKFTQICSKMNVIQMRGNLTSVRLGSLQQYAQKD